MDRFRASPWISYDPSTTQPDDAQRLGNDEMDMDIDMDAPQISTLREDDDTPPPAKTRVSKFRVKLRVNEPSSSAPPSSSPRGPHTPRDTEEDDEDEEDEEDQLADDDDVPQPVPTIIPPVITTPSHSSSSKRGGHTTSGRGRGRGRGRGKVAAPETGPMMSCFEVSPGKGSGNNTPHAVIEMGGEGPAPLPPAVKVPRKRQPRKEKEPTGRKVGRKPGSKFRLFICFHTH